MCDINDSSIDEDVARYHASAVCATLYLVVPVLLSYIMSKCVVAPLFGISGWERTLPIYFIAFLILFVALITYYFRKYRILDKITSLIIEHFYKLL